MDDIRIYNRALTTDEITAIYNNTNGYYTAEALKVRAQQTTLSTNLVARYSFDAGDATDDTGNGYDAIVTG